MHSIACSGMEPMNRDFEAEGKNGTKVKEEFLRHAMECHADMLKNMSETEKERIMKKVDDMIG